MMVVGRLHSHHEDTIRKYDAGILYREEIE
jgi:hypothetical protein